MTCDPDFEALAYRMLKLDEADRRYAYDDTTSKTVKLSTGGNLTIGIGRNLTAKGLHDDERRLCFRNDLAEALEIARDIFPDFDTYSVNRRLGIVNLIFNMGEGDSSKGFLSFDETIQHMTAGRWDRAAENLKRSKWYQDVGEGRGDRVIALIREDRYDY